MEYDQEFEKRHMEVLDLIEEDDQVALDSEEKAFDEHVNRVSDIIERLDKLEDLVTTEPLAHDATGKGDYRPGVLIDRSLRRNISADDLTRYTTP